MGRKCKHHIHTYIADPQTPEVWYFHNSRILYYTIHIHLFKYYITNLPVITSRSFCIGVGHTIIWVEGVWSLAWLVGWRERGPIHVFTQIPGFNATPLIITTALSDQKVKWFFSQIKGNSKDQVVSRLEHSATLLAKSWSSRHFNICSILEMVWDTLHSRATSGPGNHDAWSNATRLTFWEDSMPLNLDRKASVVKHGIFFGHDFVFLCLLSLHISVHCTMQIGHWEKLSASRLGKSRSLDKPTASVRKQSERKKALYWFGSGMFSS